MTLGRPPLAALFGVVWTLVALVLAATAVRLRAAPVASGWVVVSVLAGALMLCGAWLTHAWGRLESRAVLMGLTVTHQLGAAIWIGGLVQLGALWRLTRCAPVPCAKRCTRLRSTNSQRNCCLPSPKIGFLPLFF